MRTASIPFALQKRIIEFLLTLPNLNDSSAQQAFLNSAGLDSQLQQRIRVADPPSQFFHLLVPILIQYGTLEDGRHALQAILETAKAYIGQEGRARCERLLYELQSAVTEHAKISMSQESEPRTAQPLREAAPTNTQNISIGGNASGNIFQSGNRNVARIRKENDR